jgi:hypothetical protein
MATTRAPFSFAQQAMFAETVDLPTPPFSVAMKMMRFLIG